MIEKRSRVIARIKPEMTEKRPEIATGVIIQNNAGEIFLGKSTKFDGLWIVPGGHLKHGETLRECVEREIQEELGIKLKAVTFFQVQESIPPSDHDEGSKAHFVFINFLAEMVAPAAKIVLDSEEYLAFCFILPEKALAELELNDSTREFIDDYLEHKKEA